MRNLSLVLLLILIGAGIYGYANNPAACRKLGTDALADLTTIFTPGSGTGTTSPSASVAKTAPITPGPANPATAPTAPAPTPAPVADNAPVKHWQQGFATQQNGSTTTIAPAATATSPRVYADNDFTDYGEALSASQARNRPMLILFTGSDWCPYCQSLQSEVLSTSEFQQYVNSHFVFLTVDDLRNTPVMDDEKKRVAGLEQKFGTSIFPSMFVVGGDEKVIGQINGYPPGSGPTSVINGLNKYLHK
jgi:thioredoxin-related protein